MNKYLIVLAVALITIVAYAARSISWCTKAPPAEAEPQSYEDPDFPNVPLTSCYQAYLDDVFLNESKYAIALMNCQHRTVVLPGGGIQYYYECDCAAAKKAARDDANLDAWILYANCITAP